jgi:hypothetical protein
VPDVGPGTLSTRSTQELHLSLRASPDGLLERVALCNPNYLPLHYVLLYTNESPEITNNVIKGTQGDEN